jgi:hypothetical protein
MSQSPDMPSRYKTNPIEILLLSVIFVIFCNSVYQLFEKQGSFQALALLPRKWSPNSPAGLSIPAPRSPASTDVSSSTLLNLPLSCEKPSTEPSSTHATRVRLLGSFCDGHSPEISKEHSSATSPSDWNIHIKNLTNRADATVFLELNRHRFSTDYIALSPGMNQISVDIRSGDQPIHHQEIQLEQTLQTSLSTHSAVSD